jgi:fructose-bisphosphate aldolase class II
LDYDGYLSTLVYDGAHKRYGRDLSSDCIGRIELELNYIKRFCCAQYFIILSDIVKYAHARDVSVESELGQLSGIEDENTHNTKSTYTDPQSVAEFVKHTKTDSLAVAIGTSHGAYKRKSPDEKLRFDILDKIQEQIPNTPLVLHGASSVPQQFVDTINQFGGNIQNAMGIDTEQLNFAATKTNICKINIDSDLRLGFTAAIRKKLYEHPEIFNPREYLSGGRESVRDMCIFLIREVFCSYDKI